MKIVKHLVLTGLLATAMIACGDQEKDQSQGSNEASDRTTKNGKPDSNSNFEAAGRPMRIAYVNVDTINKNYKRMEAARLKLEEEVSIMQKEYDSKLRSYQNWVQKVQEDFDTYLRSKQEKVQQEMMKRQQEIQQYEQEMQMKLAQKESDLNRKNIEKIQQFCKSYAEQNGFDYVLMYQMGGPVLYANDQYDVTDDVLHELNEDYDATSIE